MGHITKRGLALIPQPELQSLSEALARGDEAALHVSLLAFVAQHGADLSTVLAPAIAPLLIQSARLASLDSGDSRFGPADCERLPAARRSLRRMSVPIRFDAAVAFVFFENEERRSATIECVFNEPSVPAVTLFDYERRRTDILQTDVSACLEPFARAGNVSFVVRTRWGSSVTSLSFAALNALAVGARVVASHAGENMPRWADTRGGSEFNLHRLPSDVRVAVGDASRAGPVLSGWSQYNAGNPSAAAKHLASDGSVLIRSDDPDAIVRALVALSSPAREQTHPIAVAV
ncbi:MAG: hypothetical protein ACI9OJ_002780 [Myxococcota bacterium]|jgi:hypothetical protein